MDDEKHKELQSLLQSIFENVNSWLTFAEAKNAALIAFNIACIAAIWSTDFLIEEKILFYLVSVGLFMSTFVAMLSFVPRMGKNNSDVANQNLEDNLLFYNDIAKYSKKSYLKQLCKRYMGNSIVDNDIKKIEEDYATEVTYNASVTVWKYRCFNFAIIIELIILVLVIIMLIVA